LQQNTFIMYTWAFFLYIYDKVHSIG